MSEQPHFKTVGDHAAAYNDLKYYFANLNTLFSIRGTLAIDMMTAMPGGGLSRRLHDISALTKRIYAETTSNAVTRLLDEVEGAAERDSSQWQAWDIANLREMRRIHTHLSALPPEIYLASVQVAGEGRKRHAQAMQEAKPWSEIQPYIAQVIDLYRRIGELKQKKFGVKTPYEALLLGYASDLSQGQMDSLYDSLLTPLSDLQGRALAKQNSMAPPEALGGDFSRTDQMWLNKTILEMMGFDFTRGTLQVSALSPMAGGSPDDTRILVRCGDSDSFLDSMEDTLYQGARGLYIQNLPEGWSSQPVGQDMGSLMMHTVSMLYETIIGRTPQFFDFIAVRAEGVFRQFRNTSFDAENLYRLKKVVTPTARRNDADELTKIFHDVMRYRIERDLINGSLDVADLPERWAEESRQYLGITPQDAAEGPLQNPDWFTGRFGFIPTNTMAHIMAATLHEKMFSEMEELPSMIQRGELRPINDWLKKSIHAKGRSTGAIALMQDMTGAPLSADALLTHLERRYLSDRR